MHWYVYANMNVSHLCLYVYVCVCMYISLYVRIYKAKAAAFGPAVASGLICGDGIWTLPSSILAFAGVNPPICMKFLSRSTNVKVDAFLGS
ncbi:hypothetical protein Hanom_Chr03g00226641 [Helianthus anomalus]